MRSKHLLLGAIGIAAMFGAWLAFSSQSQVPDLSTIERMEDTRDPKSITGSFWTSKLDCTYRNPPPEWILRSGALGCEWSKHNLTILTTKRDYFVPRSTGNDNSPPYCLVKGPASRDTISLARDYVRIYCR